MGKTKKGKVYYSCLGYPDCKFMSWDVPTGDKCPDCGSALVKMGRSGVKCSNRECSYKINGKADKGGAQKGNDADDFAPPFLMEEPIFLHYEGGEDEFYPPDLD